MPNAGSCASGARNEVCLANSRIHGTMFPMIANARQLTDDGPFAWERSLRRTAKRRSRWQQTRQLSMLGGRGMAEQEARRLGIRCGGCAGQVGQQTTDSRQAAVPMVAGRAQCACQAGGSWGDGTAAEGRRGGRLGSCGPRVSRSGPLVAVVGVQTCSRASRLWAPSKYWSAQQARRGQSTPGACAACGAGRVGGTVLW